MDEDSSRRTITQYECESKCHQKIRTTAEFIGTDTMHLNTLNKAELNALVEISCTNFSQPIIHPTAKDRLSNCFFYNKEPTVLCKVAFCRKLKYNMVSRCSHPFKY